MNLQVLITILLSTLTPISNENQKFQSLMDGKLCELKHLDSVCDHIVYIIVKNNSGIPLNDVKVEYKLCTTPGGCADTLYKAANTNNDGKSEIWWSDYCDVCTIYLNGTAYSGPFLNGNSYELII